MKNDLTVSFLDALSDIPLQFVVISAWYRGKWIFVRHKDRGTFEIAGGHIDEGEDVLIAAKRELYEETGATQFELFPIGVYGVTRADATTYGMLYFAYVEEMSDLPAEYEMAERIYSHILPDALTYPQIQPLLYARANKWLEENITTVYFIRHAQSDYSIKDDAIRPLSEKGVMDANILPQKLKDIHFDAIYSSPYQRAVQTVEPLAQSRNLALSTRAGFRERKIDNVWIENFEEFSKRQWSDFSYRLTDGECLADVQQRNITALNEIIHWENGKTIAVGTHGAALSTMINYYDPSFGYDDFRRVVPIMPYMMKMEFIYGYFLRMNEILL